MNKIVKKIICIMSIITLCCIYTMPIYATSKKETMYCKVNTLGEVYSKEASGEEKTDEMPIQTQIKYYLDDNEISIDELNGKSGKVKIKIKLTNKDKKIEEINGQKVEMYTPYIVACGTILNNKKFQNVTISSGKIIDNGNNSVVIGISMPGMQKSLDLSDVEIPENITIQAYTTDFELENIYMYIESNVFDSDLDFLDEFNSLYTDSQNLKKASTQLVEGTKQLQEGTTTYSEKIGEFNTGLATYANGVNSVSNNYSKINEGISTVNKNTKKIAEGSTTLASGITELKSNLSTIISAIGQIQKGVNGIDGGLSKMSTAVDNSITTITNTCYRS